ncbi:hypothetical protein KIW84_045922 [Lathyrus oleraceus]|uniref:Uncharacterized protein n=1 Tax=Pisum sativum TaxID=3888 RepID=A0A9D4XMD9_PEA|nr:hypothetical protein KIW84_045922 [Pisum sativum]
MKCIWYCNPRFSFARELTSIKNDVDVLKFVEDVKGYDLVDVYVEHCVDTLDIVDGEGGNNNVSDRNEVDGDEGNNNASDNNEVDDKGGNNNDSNINEVDDEGKSNNRDSIVIL